MAYFVGSSVAAAIALLYFSKKMKQHAAAAEAAANEGMRVSESLLTSAAVALKYSMVQEVQHAAAAGAAANEGMRVTESLFTSAAIALKYFKGKKAQQAAAAAAAAFVVYCNVIEVFSHVFAFHWTLLGVIFCIWVGTAVIAWIWSAGFGHFSAASRALGKDLWSVSGKWKKQRAPNDQKKTNEVVLLQALTQVEAYECTDFKGWDGHSIDGSPSLGKGQATGRVDVPVDAIATSFGYMDVALLHRSPQCVVLVKKGRWKGRPGCDVWWILRKFGNSWMRGLTCGLLSMGKRWIGMLLWPKLGYMTRTPFVVMGGFWEEGRGGSTVQAATARQSGSVDMLTVLVGTGVAHKKSLFSVW